MSTIYQRRKLLATFMILTCVPLLASLGSGELFHLRQSEDFEELKAIGTYLNLSLSQSYPQSIDNISAPLQEAVSLIEKTGVGKFGKLSNKTHFLGTKFNCLLGKNPRPLRLIMKNFIQMSQNSCELEELEFIASVEYMSAEGELLNQLARNHMDNCWTLTISLLPKRVESSVSKMDFSVFDLLLQVALRSTKPLERRKRIEITERALSLPEEPREQIELLRQISFKTVPARNKFLRALSEILRPTFGLRAVDKDGNREQLSRSDIMSRAATVYEFVDGSLMQPCHQLAARIRKAGSNLIHYEKRDALGLMREALEAARSSNQQLDYQMEMAHLCELVLDHRGLIWTQVRDMTVYS